MNTLPRLAFATAIAAAFLTACGTSQKTVPATQGASAPGSAPGPVYGKPGPGGFVWSPAMQAATGQLESALRGSGVSVAKSNDDRLWVTLPGDQSFEPNRSALLPGARTALDHVAVALRKQTNIDVRIVGHTDSKGSAAANNALSVDRAASTRDWLVARGLSPVRISVAGRGASDPIGSNDTDAGRATNRRVEILVGERGSPDKARK